MEGKAQGNIWGEWEGEEADKEGLSQWVALFLIFLPWALLWVCIMWRCVIGLWSHQSCANRLAGKHVSLRGCGGECVFCVNHRCGIVWEMVWWSKTYINGEQVGQLTLSQTNLLSWALGKCLEFSGSLYAQLHAHIIIPTHASIHKDLQCFIFIH